MLKADLIFNLLCMFLDVTGVLLFQSLRSRGARWWTQSAVVAVFTLVILALAIAVQGVFGFRHFAVMRFTGMAVFWHLPAVLVCLALFYRKKLLVGFAVLLIGLYVYAYFIEPKNLHVTRYDYSSPMLDGLQRPIVIAQISDLQSEHVSGYEERVMKTLSALKPDMIVYTGDYLQIGNRDVYVSEAYRMNALIRKMDWTPPFGSYAVLGDSDLTDEWTRVFEGTSVKLLSNQTTVVQLPGVRVSLIGIAPRTSRCPTAARLLEEAGMPDGRYLPIYVGHSPDFVRSLDQRGGPFLELAGHTHGGQVQLPFAGALITLSKLPKKYADYYGTYGSGTLSVSRGIGMERYDAPRLRFLCDPEIRLITLHPMS